MPILSTFDLTLPAIVEVVRSVRQGIVVGAHQSLTLTLKRGSGGLVPEVVRHGKPDEAPQAGQNEVGLTLGVGGPHGWTKLYISNGLRETVRFRAAIIDEGQTSEAQEACAPAGVPAFIIWPEVKGRVEISAVRTGGEC